VPWYTDFQAEHAGGPFSKFRQKKRDAVIGPASRFLVSLQPRAKLEA
jgi:hypothetical protein